MWTLYHSCYKEPIWVTIINDIEDEENAESQSVAIELCEPVLHVVMTLDLVDRLQEKEFLDLESTENSELKEAKKVEKIGDLGKLGSGDDEGIIPNATVAWFCNMNTDLVHQSCNDLEEAWDGYESITYLLGFYLKGTSGVKEQHVFVLKDHCFLKKIRCKFKLKSKTNDMSHIKRSEEEQSSATETNGRAKKSYFVKEIGERGDVQGETSLLRSNGSALVYELIAIYCEAIAMVEEYQQAVSVANLGGIRDIQGLYPQLSLKNSSQVYEILEHRLVVAEAAQKLRLPLISKDGEIHEEEIEKWSIMSRSSLDSTSTSVTISSSSNSLNYANSSANSTAGATNNALSLGAPDSAEPGVGGVPNRFLGITPTYLWQTQLQQMPLIMDTAEYQMSLSHEIEARLKDKCDKLADAFVDDIDSSSGSQNSTARLPERVKLIIEEIEREEAALQEDLYSADRKFAEYYNVLEQILAVLIKLVKDLKLQHQHKYD
ncbi:hypothetical protein GH714_024027 [Hevea brasiliensis]|nr:hypothetical protein GH714_024027 [Hevea brasiliensis]